MISSEPPSFWPGPVRNYGINESRDEAGINQVSPELGPFCHCSRNDGWGCGRENKLQNRSDKPFSGFWRKFYHEKTWMNHSAKKDPFLSSEYILKKILLKKITGLSE